ncbi:MAG TPA: helix-turn-helix transcriptional regulator [Bacteroidia bacterium]
MFSSVEAERANGILGKHFNSTVMQLGDAIKRVREAKGLSQKEAAAACKLDQSHYSRIERGKTDPTFSIVVRIAKALKVELYDLFRADILFKEASTLDKSLTEKMSLLEQLDKKEKLAFYAILDALLTKKKLTDHLSAALHS